MSLHGTVARSFLIADLVFQGRIDPQHLVHISGAEFVCLVQTLTALMLRACWRFFIALTTLLPAKLR
jgi:hypothetical protein